MYQKISYHKVILSYNFSFPCQTHCPCIDKIIAENTYKDKRRALVCLWTLLIVHVGGCSIRFPYWIVAVGSGCLTVHAYAEACDKGRLLITFFLI